MILLVNMPFSMAALPSLGLSLLKAILEKKGFSCRIQYLNVAFRHFSRNHTAYDAVSGSWIIGDYVFSDSLFGKNWSRADGRPRPEPRPVLSVIDDAVMKKHLDFLGSVADPFIAQCMDMTDWEPYQIIGFSSVYSQNTASLALAKRIKEQWPDKIIAMGGPNCGGIMGKTLKRQFPFIDWVFQGEADLSFPRAVAQWIETGTPGEIPGMLPSTDDTRDDTPRRLCDLDRLPYPDFEDYFRDLDRWAPDMLANAVLPVEMSRGCWKRKASRCLFCGLNFDHSPYRAKSAERAGDEIKALASRYTPGEVIIVDNNFPPPYFKTLLPNLGEELKQTAITIETMSHIRRWQLKVMRAAGIRSFQVGIESLDTRMLTHIRKGTTLLQNVQLLKWAGEYGMTVKWNFLYGFPGEDPGAYTRMARIIPLLHHLKPMDWAGRIVLQRFSPLYEESGKWGLNHIKASPVYESIYPFDETVLENLAFTFDSRADGESDSGRHTDQVIRALKVWQESWKSPGQAPQLTFRRTGDRRILIHDTRPCSRGSETELNGAAARLFLACDAKQHVSALVAELSGQMGAEYPGDTDIRKTLDDLVAANVMLEEAGYYLSLAGNEKTREAKP